MEKTKYSKLTNAQLLRAYNYLRNKIDGVIDGGFGKWELYELGEITREMDLRDGM